MSKLILKIEDILFFYCNFKFLKLICTFNFPILLFVQVSCKIKTILNRTRPIEIYLFTIFIAEFFYKLIFTKQYI